MNYPFKDGQVECTHFLNTLIDPYTLLDGPVICNSGAKEAYSAKSLIAHTHTHTRHCPSSDLRLWCLWSM